MKKVLYFLLNVLLLNNVIRIDAAVDVRSTLRFHNKPVEQGTNATDPVDHGRYVPYLFSEQEPVRSIVYQQGKNYPMYIAFTLIVSNGSYGDVLSAG